MNNKVYVLDTTVLVDNPNVVYDLKGQIVVPITVIRQLDGLKKNENTDVASKARRASRVLDEITAKGDPITGITMPNGSIFRLARKYTPIDILDNTSDNKIVGVADAIKKEATNGETVTLLTTDANMRIAARERGIEGEGLNTEKQIEKSKFLLFTGFSIGSIIFIIIAAMSEQSILVVAGVIFFIIFSSIANYNFTKMNRKISSHEKNREEEDEDKLHMVDATDPLSYELYLKDDTREIF